MIDGDRLAGLPTGLDTAEPEGSAQVGTGGPLPGLVVAIAQGFCEVDAGGETYLCVLRGRLRRPPTPPSPIGNRTPGRPSRGGQRHEHRAGMSVDEPGRLAVKVAPGERVLFTPLGGGQGVIEEILPRRSVLSRARSEVGSEHIMLVNLDHVVLVFAVRDPEPHFGMLDRYLALCEHTGVDVTLCFNKLDLSIPEDVSASISLYVTLGYATVLTSATTSHGLEELRERLRGRTSLITGPSGVGKSSLVNDLLPAARQRTGAISSVTGKGRHTTTGARLLPLPEGGWLADSAGIRELALWNVSSDALAHTFRELRPYIDRGCEFEDCEHSAESAGCALQAALQDGAISPERFASFQRLLIEAREAEAPRW